MNVNTHEYPTEVVKADGGGRRKTVPCRDSLRYCCPRSFRPKCHLGFQFFILKLKKKMCRDHIASTFISLMLNASDQSTTYIKPWQHACHSSHSIRTQNVASWESLISLKLQTHLQKRIVYQGIKI